MGLFRNVLDLSSPHEAIWSAKARAKHSGPRSGLGQIQIRAGGRNAGDVAAV